jgi:hypothetical protein
MKAVLEPKAAAGGRAGRRHKARGL